VERLDEVFETGALLLILLPFAFFGVRPRRQSLSKPQPDPNIVLQRGARFLRQMLQFEVFRIIHSEAYLAFVEGMHGDSQYHASRRPTPPQGGLVAVIRDLEKLSNKLATQYLGKRKQPRARESNCVTAGQIEVALLRSK